MLQPTPPRRRPLAFDVSRLVLSERGAGRDHTAASVLGLSREIARQDGLTILCSLRQHELALRFANRVVSMTDLGPRCSAL